MLSVLWMILKIIGIILAVLLGLIVLIVLMLLFVPVRYDGLVTYYNNKPLAKASITGLFKLFRFKFEYDEKVTYKAKVLFYTIFSSQTQEDDGKYDKKDNKKTDRSSKSKDKPKTRKAESVFDDEDMSFDTVSLMEEKMPGAQLSHEEETKTQAYATENRTKPNNENVIEKNTDENNADEKNTDKDNTEAGIFDRVLKRITDLFVRVKEAVISVKEKVLSVVESVREKKENATDKVNEFLRIVNDEGNREFVRFTWEQIKYLLRKLKPKKGRLYVHFGMDDPETTGNIAMYLAVLYGLMGIDINILPDFEEKIMEGELYLKGRLQLVTILILAIRFYRNKHFKRIVLQREF